MPFPKQYDALLLLSFGGPEKSEEVMPFLERVTKGRNVPKDRLLEVAAHYYHLGGRSPINDQCRSLIEALRKMLNEQKIELPIYWGNRNSEPFLEDTISQMKDDGVKRALAMVTSAYRSYSGCRQYLEDIERARIQIGEGAPVIDKIRAFFDHPRFIATWAQQLKAAWEVWGKSRNAKIIFTAHSIPLAMAATCHYQKDLESACRWIMQEVPLEQGYDLVYQSRSGPPSVPWLEPDILDHLKILHQEGVNAVMIAPIGFLSDHMEVVWDLDHEASLLAQKLKIEFYRVPTPGVHEEFIKMWGELISERLSASPQRSLQENNITKEDCTNECCSYLHIRTGQSAKI